VQSGADLAAVQGVLPPKSDFLFLFFCALSHSVRPMPYHVPAVAEPAKTLLLKYCCSRNRAATV
jgi:hypothetical protein